ncbi:MAG: hypothetical protein QOC96_2488 [Acidobacteriota bacterium]|jgi:hypothetical protein|nr:hypothetical protein [Acidobacteriota bacterium]
MLKVFITVIVDRETARRLASFSKQNAHLVTKSSARGAGVLVEIDDEAKQIVQDLGTAINSAVEKSSQVAEAIERLREAGYEMELTLRLEIALRQQSEDDATESQEAALELTDEDMRTLRRMKIRIDTDE